MSLLRRLLTISDPRVFPHAAVPSWNEDDDPIPLRLAIARAEQPRLVLWGAPLIAVFSLINLLTDLGGPITPHVSDLVIVLVLLVSGRIMTRSYVPPEAVPWIYSAATTSVVVGLMSQVLYDDTPGGYVYAVVAMCLVGPSTLAWVPFVVSYSLMLACAAAVSLAWPEQGSIDWWLVALASTAVAAVLLRLRLTSIDALQASLAEVRRLAVTDSLTDALNRRGLLARIPGLWSMAERGDEPVFAVFIDIRGLKRANDEHGHEFGDRVIQAAARAVTRSVRAGDLVARWGGDEIVVIGIGSLPEAAAFAERLRAGHEWTGEDRARWDGDLSLGFATLRPPELDIDALISAADADMYRRREADEAVGEAR